MELMKLPFLFQHYFEHEKHDHPDLSFSEYLQEHYLNESHEDEEKGHCDDWALSADGALVLILTFDQFPRNMFRGKDQAYATDDKALSIAALAIERGFDQVFIPLKRRFFYLPFEHSENIDDQYRSVELFGKMKDDDPLGLEYAERHLRVIEQFGRFPHRNEFLGRESTPAELAYLKEYGGF